MWRGCCTVEPALFLFMLASFLSYPVYQQLIFHTLCYNDEACSTAITNQSSCKIQDATVLQYQREASHWILYTNLAASLPAILLSLLYGSLSDVFGRKQFIILPAVGGAVNSIVILIVQYVRPNDFRIYLIGAGVSGLTGGFSVFNLAVYSYIANSSNYGNRTQRMAWLEATSYLSSFLSQLVSGIWIERQGFSIPYFGILACQISVIFYVLLFLPSLPQSLPQSTSSENKPLLNSDKKESGRAFLLTIVTVVTNNVFRFVQLFSRSWRLILLSFVFFVLEVNFLGITDTVILYALTRLCWSSDLIGYFLAEKSFCNAVAAMIILPLLMKFKVKDTHIAIIGLVSGATALVMMGVASNTWIMFIAPVVGAIRGCVVPIVRSLMSKLTPDDQQGVMFSGLSVIEASCILFASSLYNTLFPLTYSLYPGFCFFLMALCSLFIVPFMCFLSYERSTYHQSKGTEQTGH